MRRGLALILIVLPLIGCDRRSFLGGEAAQPPACVADCGLVDAGQALLDAEVKRPGPRIESSGGVEAVAAFVSGIEGTWWGVATKVGPLAEDEDARANFEIDLVGGSEVGLGQFYVRCVPDSECDPFGFGSATADGGSFKVVNLAPDADKISASGELEWVITDSRGDAIRLSATFFDMKRDDTKGPALTFGVGALNGGSAKRAVLRVVLALGPRPTDAGVTPMPDSGLLDAGTP